MVPVVVAEASAVAVVATEVEEADLAAVVVVVAVAGAVIEGAVEAEAAAVVVAVVAPAVVSEPEPRLLLSPILVSQECLSPEVKMISYSPKTRPLVSPFTTRSASALR